MQKHLKLPKEIKVTYRKMLKYRLFAELLTKGIKTSIPTTNSRMPTMYAKDVAVLNMAKEALTTAQRYVLPGGRHAKYVKNQTILPESVAKDAPNLLMHYKMMIMATTA